MQLETYISDLLYRYECVTIPEFGAFLTQRASATIDNSTNTFKAPSKSISFNEQIQKNDGLLAHYIADVEKIPFEVANKKIDKRVKLLKSYLIQGETLTFKNIGDITLNNEGKIVFEPTYQLNYLTDSFGLSQFASPVITREVYKKDVEAIEKVVPITVTAEKRKSRPYLKYAAIALIALTVGGLGGSKYYIDSIENHNKLAQEQADDILENKIQQATFNLNPLPAITLNVSKQTGNYHIIAGAFRVEDNCNKKIKQLKESGFKARKIGVNKYGLHEVAYGSYETRLEANRALASIKKSHNKDAWLKVDYHSNSNANKPKYNAGNSSKVNTETLEVRELLNENEFTYNESPNIIQILKGVTTVEDGFYNVLASYPTIEKRDEFISFLASKGINANFFLDSNTGKYFIYHKDFDDILAAKASIELNKALYKDLKVAIVKVEN
ncbi:HU domain-containing protein [Seonamhaeicola marinus]|uniref:SPOR domain-containing protein n=1 Tax=Seonamhaeicola marinus TaxID=1912246 RepID=A0A5D0HS65_9FLAO|nr:SPOR domain-containing protein [Seonamhaeicola marinus]TYA74085.1 SPOR domain-containing protein [Seonamhaeicola marinus]